MLTNKIQNPNASETLHSHWPAPYWVSYNIHVDDGCFWDNIDARWDVGASAYALWRVDCYSLPHYLAPTVLRSSTF